MTITQLLYIDPAATSVLITSLTAIVVAVGASAIVIWRKLKKKVDKTLKIDPNANKEVEEELVILDEETEQAQAQTEEKCEEDNAPETEDAPVEPEEVTPAEPAEENKDDE